MQHLKFMLYFFAFSLLLIQCKQNSDDPNSIKIQQIDKELASIKNKNIVFGVDKLGLEKKRINQQNINQKIEELAKLNEETRNSYLTSKDFINNNSVDNEIETKNNKLALNEYLFEKSKKFMASLWKEKVYEGSELENAYWLITNQIEQIGFLKTEIDKLRKN